MLDLQCAASLLMYASSQVDLLLMGAQIVLSFIVL